MPSKTGAAPDEFAERQLLKRAVELADRSLDRDIPCFTEFLTLAEQDSLQRTFAAERPWVNFTFDGGYPEAERRVACFGADSAPLIWLEIAPTAPKFAETLAHRDFLGALMSLGMRRETMGDILITDNRAYLAALETAAEFISAQLESVRHTPVKVSRIDKPPVEAAPRPEPSSVVVSSPRLDALIAAVWKLSRSDAQSAVERRAVFINGRCIEDSDHTPAVNDIVSVRGLGRFVFLGIERETRKGRLRVDVGLYAASGKN